MNPPPDRRALAASLAPDVVEKPAPTAFAAPVAWVLGPELVGSLIRLLRHTFFRGELDVRDWMTATTHTLAPDEGTGELWFDFVSDVGDGQRATYSTALVCQDDLYVAGDGPGAAALPAQHGGVCPAGMTTLPRGQLLIVGGDAAYPVADTGSLERRLRQPFSWAYRDLVSAGRLVDDAGRPHRLVDLLGIPSNHDYYDDLVGWNRLFRAPLTSEGVPGPEGQPPPLTLLGFRRRQSASYFALRLPWDWQLWALDTGEDGIDLRQDWFFHGQGAADKLILLTPSPALAFGRRIASRALARSLERLAIPETPPPGGCRLDLAGDVHHYERYAPSGDPARHTSVAAGGGGAFHHPSFQDFGEVPMRAVYPEPAVSRRAVAAALFHPATIYKGGVLGALTFLLAVLVCAGSLAPGTRVIGDTLLGWLGVHAVRAWPGGAHVAALAAPAWSELRAAAVLGASLCVSGMLLAVALRYLRFRVSWILAAGAISLPALTPLLAPRPAAWTVLFQLFCVTVMAGLGAGFVVFAVRVGADEHPARGRPWFLALGGWHAFMQILFPLLIVRLGLGQPLALAAVAALSVGLAVVGRACLTAGARWLVTAAWAAQGAGAIAILVLAADGVTVVPAGAAVAAFLLVAGAVGAVAGCLNYGWYLAVAAAHGGHNNEVGAAARIESFRQFIRFRLREDRLTGYVIAIDEPGCDPASVRPRVVDVFTVKPTP